MDGLPTVLYEIAMNKKKHLTRFQGVDASCLLYNLFCYAVNKESNETVSTCRVHLKLLE